LGARGAARARQNWRNHQIDPVLQMPFGAPDREKWRPTVDLAPQTPREAGGLRERKVWQTRVLQSSALGSEHGEMALWALEKAPFSATFRDFFVDFPRVFSASLPLMAPLGANATSNCACSFLCFERFLLSSLPAFLIAFERGGPMRERNRSASARTPENVNMRTGFLGPRQADPTQSDETAPPRPGQKLQ
jgi:hypothetical protein